MNKITALIVLLAIQLSVFAQTKQESAHTRAAYAIELMDEGKVEESIVILKECMKLDKGNYLYPYEVSYAYMLKEDFETALVYMKKSQKCKNANYQVYQQLGNINSILGRPQKAIKLYERGMKIFPNAGALHLEKGNVFLGQQQYSQAVINYRNGIVAQPMYPSNYYRLALLYLSSKDKLAGLIYGELFMNIERGSNRTIEMSKYLFDTYKENVQFGVDSVNNQTIQADFCKNEINITNISDLNNLESIIPMCLKWSTSFLLAIAENKDITVQNIGDIRSKQLDFYYQVNDGEILSKPVACVLFDYHQKIKEAGHFEAYNRYIFQMADVEAFEVYSEEHKEELDSFIEWYRKPENMLKITNDNYYLNR